MQRGRGGRRSRALTGTDGWLERLMTRARPIAHNLWIVDGPAVRWFTMPFPMRMTIARLVDGSLFVHSPIELTAEVREAVARWAFLAIWSRRTRSITCSGQSGRTPTRTR